MALRASLGLPIAILFTVFLTIQYAGCTTPPASVAPNANSSGSNSNSSNDSSSSGDATPVVILNNHNAAGVRNGPTEDTQFTITQRYRITSIETYHWNSGKGVTSPGSISLFDDTGVLVGNWSCSGRSGQGGVPNAYWTCLPEWEISAGTYTVVDSDPITWSCNGGSEEAGICIVMGVPLGGSDGAPSDGSADSPETVAKRYFDSQMAGDTQGMLDDSALHLMADDELAEAKAAVDVIAQRATLSGLSFTHLATGYDSDRTMAMVRCQHEVRVTVDGVSAEQEGGTLFWMVWHEGRWKIRNVFPDELIALAWAEENGILSEREQRILRLYTWREVSDAFSKELMTATLDTGKLALDTKGSAVGAKPLTGDALSWWYTVGDMAVTLKETADDYQKGRYKSVFWGVSSFSWGFVQLAAEIAPGWDHAADGVGAALDQLQNWQQQKETYFAMLSSLKYGDFSEYDAYLILQSQSEVPAGVSFDLAENWIGDGIALEGITFLTDEAHRSGKPLVFDVGALIAVHQDETPTYFARAVFMGAPVSGFDPHKVAYLGAKITDLIIEDERDGAEILSPKEVGPSGASYNVKAMRGLQTLTIRVRGNPDKPDVTTKPVSIENRVFNLVDGIAIGTSRESATSILQLRAGETLTGQNIYGTYSSLVDAVGVTPPLLTAVDPSTLTMENSAIASFAPEGSLPNLTLAVTGIKEGETDLALHLPTGHGDIRSLDAAVRIEVGDDSASRTLSFTASDTKTASSCGGCPPFEVVLERSASVDVSVKWSGVAEPTIEQGSGESAHVYDLHVWDVVDPVQITGLFSYNVQPEESRYTRDDYPEYYWIYRLTDREYTYKPEQDGNTYTPATAKAGSSFETSLRNTPDRTSVDVTTVLTYEKTQYSAYTDEEISRETVEYELYGISPVFYLNVHSYSTN